MGAIVDAVEEVVQLRDDSIEPAPDFGGSPDTQYIMGVTTCTGSVKTLLDIQKIFLDDASITRALPDGKARESALLGARNASNAAETNLLGAGK
jgi:hypothetical protein